MHDTTGRADHTFTRRMFLHRGLTFASLAATAPMFLERSARGMTLPLGSLVTSQAGVPEDRVLVVVQLGGGNDGLNTVVPYFSPEYYRLRPTLAIPAPGRGDNAALPFDEDAGVGLHPNLTGLKELLDEGAASVIQGVGYPNPNRSHFTSMDIWETADTSAKGRGWIGRYFDHTCEGQPSATGGVALGREAPLAMMGEQSRPVSFERPELFSWSGHDLHTKLNHPYEQITRKSPVEEAASSGNEQLEFLMRTTLDAQISSDRIRRAMAKDSLVRYPRGPLAEQLRMVGAMIRDELPTRVYYVSLGGFDTHANQGGQHANLVRQLGSALKTFHDDLKAQGNSKRVLTMVFSEFGRRVAQNGSGGTDHGTAAPMYLMGDMVRPGLLGDHPSLGRLDEGDLIFNVDFRSIYAAILEDWMGANSVLVLGASVRMAAIFA